MLAKKIDAQTRGLGALTEGHQGAITDTGSPVLATPAVAGEGVIVCLTVTVDANVGMNVGGR
ncbi:hypothetical protein E0L36_22495 [Streptomyces sp. AJS327]|uniref:hypothetical protein n=1 Tax=Streptomyces sp. AJS327 TaxID=2545265 RepID=UPI0015DDD654|nr:hypothetical protein [Streptomyces sp. AJS327]MBA0053545.1 hypothetical protein [Streptomyces sp. AJS327]